MSIENGVSNELLACIHDLMKQDTLIELSLGMRTAIGFDLKED